MFANWIDLAEPVHIARRLAREPVLLGKLAAKLRLTSAARVRATWAHVATLPVTWSDIAAVRARCNAMVTGDAGREHYAFVAERYLAGRNALTALSLGCGNGARDLEWAKTGCFARIDAYDLSEPRIRAAAEAVRGTPLEGVIRYQAADINRLELPIGRYDLAYFEHSLHHMSPMEPLLLRVRESLKPGGLLVANEFVGPSRFQWTDAQLDATNELLASFPPQYASPWQSRHPRLPARRPSKLALWLSDPSEAVESANILPLVGRHFSGVEVRGYGGAILHLLFAGIAHHFAEPDATARGLLDRCFAREDELLRAGRIVHDFALVVGRR